MLVIVQIWDAQNQEVTRRVGATSRRIASKIAEVLHDGKTAKIVPKADICNALALVRFGSKADMTLFNWDVRFTRKRTLETTVGMSAKGQ